jgi:hypothetical protein
VANFCAYQQPAAETINNTRSKRTQHEFKKGRKKKGKAQMQQDRPKSKLEKQNEINKAAIDHYNEERANADLRWNLPNMFSGGSPGLRTST